MGRKRIGLICTALLSACLLAGCSSALKEGTEALGAGDYEKALMLQVLKFNDVINTVYEETAPHKICAYIYDLANEFNKFYHETKILAEEDQVRRDGYISLLVLTKRVLETCIDLLGFEAPERM